MTRKWWPLDFGAANKRSFKSMRKWSQNVRAERRIAVVWRKHIEICEHSFLNNMFVIVIDLNGSVFYVSTTTAQGCLFRPILLDIHANPGVPPTQGEGGRVDSSPHGETHDNLGLDGSWVHERMNSGNSKLSAGSKCHHHCQGLLIITSSFILKYRLPSR